MRIRSIKPEFFCDEILDELPAEVRLAYAGLWCYCDDAGRGLDDRWLIKAAIAPRRDADTPTVVEGWLAALAAAGRILRYEIGGRRYLQILRWEHQKIDRPGKSKYPPPPLDEPSTNTHRALAEPSPRAREDLEQGTGNREQGTGSAHEAPPEPDPAPVKRRGSRIPLDWAPTDSLLEWATTKHPRVDVSLATEAFVNHAQDKGRTSRSVEAAWRNWIIKAESIGPLKPGTALAAITNGHGPKRSANQLAVDEAMRRMGVDPSAHGDMWGGVAIDAG